MQISFLKLKKTKNESNQTMVVKHCQAFQISVAHQRDLEKHTTTNTHHPEPNGSESKTRTPLYRNQNKRKAAVTSVSVAQILHKVSWGL